MKIENFSDKIFDRTLPLIELNQFEKLILINKSYESYKLMFESRVFLTSHAGL